MVSVNLNLEFRVKRSGIELILRIPTVVAPFFRQRDKLAIQPAGCTADCAASGFL